MQLYQKFRFDCSDQLKEFGIDILNKEWDYKSLKIIRVNRFDERLNCLKKELQEKNFPNILSMSIFCRGPSDQQIIHIDTINSDSGQDIISNGNFYVPLVNEGGKIVWFDKSKGTETIEYTPGYVNSTKVPTGILKWSPTSSLEDAKLGEYAENDPVIINTTIPHRGESTTHPRAVLVFRVEGNPDLFKLISR